jgi:hypothetical protein
LSEVRTFARWTSSRRRAWRGDLAGSQRVTASPQCAELLATFSFSN